MYFLPLIVPIRSLLMPPSPCYSSKSRSGSFLSCNLWLLLPSRYSPLLFRTDSQVLLCLSPNHRYLQYPSPHNYFTSLLQNTLFIQKYFVCAYGAWLCTISTTSSKLMVYSWLLALHLLENVLFIFLRDKKICFWKPVVNIPLSHVPSILDVERFTRIYLFVLFLNNSVLLISRYTISLLEWECVMGTFVFWVPFMTLYHCC